MNEKTELDLWIVEGALMDAFMAGAEWAVNPESKRYSSSREFEHMMATATVVNNPEIVKLIGLAQREKG